MFDAGARALGFRVFPAGVGQTDAQVDALRRLRADGYVGTPDFLKILLDRARELAADIPSLRKALVGGGALTPALRDAIRAAGVDVLQCYGPADLCIVASEAETMDGMISAEQGHIGTLRPGTAG